MRLGWTTGKYSITYRAVKTVRINGKNKTQIVKTFGSEKQIWADIITKESGWNVYATNPSSGAYGLPQSLPGNKMASVGGDYLTNPYTQLMWMYKYVHERYGSFTGVNWYSRGWY